MRFPVVSLGDVARPVERPLVVTPGTTYRTIGVKWWGEGAYERATIDGSGTAARTLYLVREGDLIINKIWVRHGSTAIATKVVDGCAASNEFPMFELDASRVLPRWMHWLTKTSVFWDECAALSRGTSGKNRIKPGLFLTINVPLPSIDEQRRIVARIEELAARIEEARGLRQQAVESAAALELASSNSVFDPVKIARWPVVRLGDVADIRSGVTLGRNLIGHTIRLPYLRVANVQDGYLDLSLMKEVEVLPDEAKKWLLQCGDVLLTEGGDWDKLGRGTVWQGEITNCIHQNHIFRVRVVNSSEFDPHFVSALIGSPYGKKYFQASAKQTTNLASINQRQLKAFELYKPSISEQQQIVILLDRVRSKVIVLRQLQEETAAELNAMLPSLLERAFSGLL